MVMGTSSAGSNRLGRSPTDAFAEICGKVGGDYRLLGFAYTGSVPVSKRMAED